MAGCAPRQRERALGRVLQEGLGPAEHLVAGVRGRGALLRMDRWHPKETLRTELRDPFHAPPRGQHLERRQRPTGERDRKSTRLNSSHSQISYAVFCLTIKNISFL